MILEREVEWVKPYREMKTMSEEEWWGDRVLK